MKFYALFDPAVPEPSPVTGWIDADGLAGMASPPGESHRLEITVEQWIAHMSNPGGYAISAGSVSAYTPPAAPAPVLTLGHQAQALLAGGLTITSTGTPAINGLYPCDDGTRATIAEVVAGISAGQGFPGGGATFDFDIAGGHVVIPSTAAFVAIGAAVRDFVYGCIQVVMGRSTTLPPANVTIA